MIVLSRHLWVLSFFLLTFDVEAGLYYDNSSCEIYQDVLDAGFKSAFEMVNLAIEAIGTPPNGGTAQWSFPDSETRDLAARIFGGASHADKSIPARYTTVKGNFEYIRDSFSPTNQVGGNGILIQNGVTALTDTDILVYCDLSRLTGGPYGWYQHARSEEGTYSRADYKTCKSGETLAVSNPNQDVRQVIQLCRMDKLVKKKYKILPDRQSTWFDNRRSFKHFCKRLFRAKKWEVDFYDLFDHTLIHEVVYPMTHCIREEKDEAGVYTRIRTSDWGDEKGYHWEGVQPLSSTDGWKNADSYAFFSLGAWMLKRKQTKISNTGCLTVDSTYQYGSQAVEVDGSWTAPAQKRAPYEHMNLDDKSQIYERNLFNPLELGDFTTRVGTIGFSSLTTAGTLNTSFILSSTLSYSASEQGNISTATSDTFYKSGSTTGISSIAVSESSTSSQDITSTGSTTVSESSTSSQDNTGSSSPGVLESSTSSQHITNSSATAEPASSTPAQDATGSSFKDISEGPLSTISSAQSDFPSKTPGPPSITSALTLPPFFFSETPTTTPDGAFLLCPALTSCIKPTPTWLEEIISAPTDFFIPKITDLGAVRTKKVKQNEDDDDDKAIIFARVELPTDKCNSIPKPKPGGLLGVVANVANKVVDTVMDAACNMEFPVIDTNLPDWLDLTKFPGLKDYPPPSGNPTGPESPSPSNKESSASSSSSSCTVTGVPKCEVTAIISDTVTNKVTSCTTISACSQTGATDVTSTTVSCSATAIPRCKGTQIVSGTMTKAFTTECSTITACSGTGATSMTDITAIPSATDYVHPEDPEGWDEQQECFMDLMENTHGDVSDDDLASCLGISKIPVEPETSKRSSSNSHTTDHHSTSSPSPTPSPTSSSSPIPSSSTAPQVARGLSVMLLAYPMIGGVNDDEDWEYTHNSWALFETTPGVQVDACKTPPILNDEKTRFHDPDDDLDGRLNHDLSDPGSDGQAAIEHAPWPHGTFTLTLFGEDNCQYLNDGNSPGILHCPSFADNVGCQADPETETIGSFTQCDQEDPPFHYTRKVLCNWEGR